MIKKYNNFIKYLNEGKYEDIISINPGLKYLFLDLKKENFPPILLNWVARNATYEDLDLLLDFLLAKNNNLKIRKDLNSYKDIDELREELKLVEDNINRIKERSQVSPILSVNNWDLYILNTFNECKKLLSGSNICISKKPLTFDKYNIDSTDDMIKKWGEKNSVLGKHTFYLLHNKEEKSVLRKIIFSGNKHICVMNDYNDRLLNTQCDIFNTEIDDFNARIWKKWSLGKSLNINHNDIKEYYKKIPQEIVDYLNIHADNFKNSFENSLNPNRKIEFLGCIVTNIYRISGLDLWIDFEFENNNYTVNYDNEGKLLNIKNIDRLRKDDKNNKIEEFLYNLFGIS